MATGDKARQEARVARQSGNLIAERAALTRIPLKKRTNREQSRLDYLRRVVLTRREHERLKERVATTAQYRALGLNPTEQRRLVNLTTHQSDACLLTRICV